VVEEQEVQRTGGKAVVAGQRLERASAVTDPADHAGHPVGHAGMRPNLPGVDGVGFGEFDGVHLGGRCGPGDAQRPVAAIGAQLESEFRVGAAHRGVEQHALLVADVDQHRLLVGEPIDGGHHVVDVARAGVLQHVFDRRGLASVADLARRGDVAGPGRHPQDRPPQERDALLQSHEPNPNPVALQIGW
jgi:hypothetical protein